MEQEAIRKKQEQEDLLKFEKQVKEASTKLMLDAEKERKMKAKH